MDVKKEDIEQIKKLEEELHQVRTDLKAMVSQAKAKEGDNTIELERGGEEVEVTEKDLWNELKDPTATPDGRKQAREVLEERHSKIFEKLDEEEELSKAVNKKFTETFEFPFQKITPARFLRVVEAFVDYLD